MLVWLDEAGVEGYTNDAHWRVRDKRDALFTIRENDIMVLELYLQTAMIDDQVSGGKLWFCAVRTTRLLLFS